MLPGFVQWKIFNHLVLKCRSFRSPPSILVFELNVISSSTFEGITLRKNQITDSRPTLKF